MPRVYLLPALLLTAAFLSPVLAEPIYECADAGEKICSDEDVPAAAPTDDGFPSAQDECNSICSSLANRVERGLSDVWVCTATSADFTGYSTDPHGTQFTHCSCDVTCVKGVIPREIDGVIFQQEF